MWIGCASPVRLATSQTSVEPTRGVSVARSAVAVRGRARNRGGRPFAVAVPLGVVDQALDRFAVAVGRARAVDVGGVAFFLDEDQLAQLVAAVVGRLDVDHRRGAQRGVRARRVERGVDAALQRLADAELHDQTVGRRVGRAEADRAAAGERNDGEVLHGEGLAGLPAEVDDDVGAFRRRQEETLLARPGCRSLRRARCRRRRLLMPSQAWMPLAGLVSMTGLLKKPPSEPICQIAGPTGPFWCMSTPAWLKSCMSRSGRCCR